jgi:Alpha-L-fucosidase
MKKLLNSWTLLIVFFASRALYAQPVVAQSDGARTQWFTDARFGMFIHWGLYSAAEGVWKGENLRYMNNYAEWIRYRNRIPAEAYGQLAERFVWEEINPEQWVLLAKRAGMKYIIITAKHHDGAAIWDTGAGEYSLPALSGIERDPIAELASACRKHGMKLGFYYSHWIDWQHPFGWDHNQELTGRVSDSEYDQYWQQKVIPQLRELLTDYGDIALLWFDMWIPFSETIVKREQLEQVLRLVRELQPGCLVNSRLGLPASEDGIDFETLGDNQFGGVYKAHPWETPGTVAHSWGYNALENEWKSTTQLLQSLIGNVSLNGGFTLNIGPRADGSVPYETVRRLEDMGQWLAVNGEAVYGAGGISLRPAQHDWGRITRKTTGAEGERLYLHVYNWPLDRLLRVSGITSVPTRIYLLNDEAKEPLPYERIGPYLHIRVPEGAPDPYVSVIALEFDKPVQLDTAVVAESSFGGMALNGSNVLHLPERTKQARYDGLRPAHLVIAEPTTLRWRIYVQKPTAIAVDISYSNQADADGTISLETGGKQLSAALPHTGQVVVEPNEQYYTDEFRERPLGEIVFDGSGYHEVSVHITPKPGQQILLNRLWMAPGNE